MCYFFNNNSFILKYHTQYGVNYGKYNGNYEEESIDVHST